MKVGSLGGETTVLTILCTVCGR